MNIPSGEPFNFTTITGDNWRHSIAIARARGNKIVDQLTTQAVARIVTPADQQRAAAIGDLLGGNGLTQIQQLELVAMHVALNRMRDMARGRGEWRMNAILQMDSDIKAMEQAIKNRMAPKE